MSRRLLLICILFCLFALLPKGQAFAGGWAVLTLDEWPGSISAGKPIEIGFTVRQHGTHPMSGLTPTVTLQDPKTGEKTFVEARPQGEVGHYSATITLPNDGEWAWSIQAFTMDQPMPPLVVAAGESPSQANRAIWPSTGILTGLVGFGMVLVAAVAALRSRTRWALALAALGIIVSISGFVYASNQQRSAQAASEASALTAKELGQRLFVAKGCVTCHSHRDVINRANISLDFGPDLTSFTASPEYLRLWLKDPQSVKPNETKMPNLGLKQAEIEALITFINAE